MSRLTTIEIEGKQFTYNNEDGDFTQKSLSPISKEDAEETLKFTKKCLDDRGIKFCLSFGTLLGAVRENGIIPGDEDVDVYTAQEEDLYRNLPWLYEKGLRVIRIRKGILYSFRVNERCFIDIYILRPLKNSIWSCYCYSLEGCAIPKKYVKESQELLFLGEQYYCPKDPERVLEWWYGKNWRIPMSVKGHYEVRSRALWKKVKYYVTHAPNYFLKKMGIKQ